MQEYEASTLFDCLEYADKAYWEMARMQMYITAQVNSTKRLTPQDIMKFKWDNTDGDKPDIEISNEDIARMKAKQEKFQQILKNSKKG